MRFFRVKIPCKNTNFICKIDYNLINFKKNMKNSILIIIFILILVIGGVSLYLYIYANQPPKSDTCQNLCGDGICQEVVCEAIGCPCPETSESCPQDCPERETTEDETASWKIYKNLEYVYQIKYPMNWSFKEEIPQPQNFGIKVSFSNSAGTYVLSIQNPIPEIGYESSNITKTEKIKIQDSERYFTKKILEPLPGKEDFNNLILVTWNEDNWQKSGQISLGYKEDTNPNIKILDQMLSTFKFLE